MKILVITGSPRKNGNSNTLAEYFIKGATEKGHKIVRFDSAFKNVHPCIACEKCKTRGKCAFDDDFNFIKENIEDTDMIVFASPVYFFGLSAQIKAAIDRFYSIESSMKKPIKSALLLTLADTSIRTAQASVDTYRGTAKYLGWNSIKEIIATGVWNPDDIKQTEFSKEAYELGCSI